MTLTDDDAVQVLNSLTALLQKREAQEVLAGIDESRRLGLEEVVAEFKNLELKQVARTRRRPPSNLEMLHIVIGLIYERLVVLPAIGLALKNRFASEDIRWRVDTEFASVERFPEATLTDLLPAGVEDVMGQLAAIIKMVQIQDAKDI